MDLSRRVPFGDGYLLGGDLGQVYYINESAYAIMRALADAPPEKPLGSLAGQFKAHFNGSEHAALEGVKAVAHWLEERSRQSTLNQPSSLPLQHSHSARLQVNGVSIELDIEDSALFELLRPMTVHLDAPGLPRSGCRIAVTGTSRTGRYELYVDGELKDLGPDIFYARHMALEGIALASIATPECFALLHAAAVSFQGTGVALSGPSGVGKTTLLLGLLSAGADFISDDIVPLVGRDAVAMPIPFAIGVKRGSWTLARRIFPNYNEVVPIRLGDRLVRYFPPVAGGVFGLSGECEAGVIVMPEYDPDVPAEIRRFTPLEALTLAADYGSWFGGSRECLEYLAAFYDMTLAAAVRYRTLDEGVALTRELIAEAKKARRRR